MKEYNPSKIEEKWQKIWEEEKRYNVKNHEEGKENKYILIEFPYPSGKGLHVGHVRSYTALDVVARKLRLENKNVLFPIGCDAFGLEAERTAIKEKTLPQNIVARNIATFKEQLQRLGLSFDWSRQINTCDPEYYKWTQWLFLQFFKKGIAFKKDVMVNFCKECGVLANEEVENGKCCQCHGEVVQKPKSQWIMKMTDYAERLDEDLSKTEYLEHIKASQHNWIGKSKGVEVEFGIKEGKKIKVFTTCIETIYGCTFIVLAPEHPEVKELKNEIKNYDEVEKYIKQASKKSEFERRELVKEKTGCKLEGITAINPATNEEIAVYIGDFVLADYGTGAVMAVPAHDQRDFDFAKEHKLAIKEVISGGEIEKRAFEKQEYLGNNCKLINSEEFSGMVVEDAKEEITKKLEKQGKAQIKLNFKMRDWIFSRQRYWGEPIPIIHCKKCGMVAVPEKELPLLLPKVASYETTKDGESPLSTISEFVNTTCPQCGMPAKRETDTMPGWAGSSWYFMRYCDPHNEKEFASQDALKAWLPVDLYNGGNEHTTRHLLYSRFWVKALYDMGIVPVDEPFKSRISQGMILGANGIKMSKSLGNVVDPREIIKEYGADALRLWEMFIGNYPDTVNWDDNGTKACYKFLSKVYKMQEFLCEGDSASKELQFVLNQTIKKVSEDIDTTKFNTAISQMFIFVNEVYKVGKINKFEYKTLLTLLNPFAPHVTEEIWTQCKFTPNISNAKWPKYDQNALELDFVEVPVQICGKLKAVINLPKDCSDEQALNIAKENSVIASELNDKQIKKVIHVKNRILNLIV